MKITHNIIQGIDSIRANALRAVITCLIIAIGIAALVGILTAIDGMKMAITQTFSKMGSQSFNIQNAVNFKRHGGSGGEVEYKPITYVQATRFKSEFQFPGRISISKRADAAVKASYRNKESNPNIQLFGIDENYLITSAYDLKEGRNITSNDVDLGLPLVIIGKEIAYKLFENNSCVGKEIQINGKKYLIIGELKEKGSSLGMNGGDRVVFLPVSRLRQDFGGMDDNFRINMAVNEVKSLDPAMDEAYLEMRRIRGLRVNDPDNFVMNKSDAMAKEAISNMGMVSTVGTVIAIITLIGAAISLMNIMLVSVTERTREIGVRKALGAGTKTIRNQFLTEAIVICQIGGVGGVILGMLLGNLVAVGIGGSFIIPWLWIAVAFLVCLIVGLIAGIFPANKAAKMDPIESLRYE